MLSACIEEQSQSTVDTSESLVLVRPAHIVVGFLLQTEPDSSVHKTVQMAWYLDSAY